MLDVGERQYRCGRAVKSSSTGARSDSPTPIIYDPEGRSAPALTRCARSATSPGWSAGAVPAEHGHRGAVQRRPRRGEQSPRFAPVPARLSVVQPLRGDTRPGRLPGPVRRRVDSSPSQADHPERSSIREPIRSRIGDGSVPPCRRDDDVHAVGRATGGVAAAQFEFLELVAQRLTYAVDDEEHVAVRVGGLPVDGLVPLSRRRRTRAWTRCRAGRIRPRDEP